MPAAVIVDSFPDRTLDGWVGFISPVAEFTPKSVQTEDLRTSLVYEVRVFVKDPDTVAARHAGDGQLIADKSDTSPVAQHGRKS